MKIKRSILAPVLVAFAALASGGWLLQRGAGQQGNVYQQARLFEAVLHQISERFVDEKDPATLYRMAIDGLLHELGDPHTTLMTPQEYNQLRLETQGEYGGLGIQIGRRDGWITVIAPLRGTPAERAGLQAGDRIIEVDGVSTKGWSEDEAVARLRGPRGSPVELKVLRSGVDEPIPFRIVRDEIKVSPLGAAYLVDRRVGYVELQRFSESSTDSLRAAIDRLRRQGMRGLILDLRRNPGGLLEQGVAVSDLFLGRGQTVVETRSRIAMQNQKYTATEGDQYPGMPIVVLVDRSSASAAEIVAGALQDHDRALIVGETTYGKGSVQTLFELPGGNHLKLTTARWYTPVGRSIQRPYDANGVPVEEEAEETGAEPPDSAKPAEVFRTDAGRIVYGGGGIRPDVVLRRDTLSAREQEFVRAIQKYGSKFRDVVFTYAVSYARQHPALEPDFGVTPEMLDGFYRALQAAGIVVDRALYDGATRWVAWDLGAEIANAKWGPAEARRRLNAADPWVQVAARLLGQASSPRELFAVAERFVAEPGGAAKGPGAAARRP